MNLEVPPAGRPDIDKVYPVQLGRRAQLGWFGHLNDQVEPEK